MNIDEFLDTVATPAAPVNAPPVGPKATISPSIVAPPAVSVIAGPQTAPMSSPDGNATPHENAQDQFDSLALSLETSLAAGDYQHAFDTYIAIQSTLARMIEQHRKLHASCQERLTEFKKKVFDAVQVSSAQFQSVMQDTYLHLGRIRELADAGDVDGATSLYVSVKHTVDQLPAHLSEKRAHIEDDLIKVYLYLKDKKEQQHAKIFGTTAAEMKRLFVGASAAIKTGNVAQAHELYEQLAAKYAALPDGFTEHKVQLFDYVTFLHSQLNLLPQSAPSQSLQSTNVSAPSATPAGRLPEITIGEQSRQLRVEEVPARPPSPPNSPVRLPAVSAGSTIARPSAPPSSMQLSNPSLTRKIEATAVPTQPTHPAQLPVVDNSNLTQPRQNQQAQASSDASSDVSGSVQLQKRAKELTARLEELKKTLSR